MKFLHTASKEHGAQHTFGHWFFHYKADVIIAFVIAFAINVYWQYSGTIGDPDGFYHAKIAQFLLDGQVLKELPWMQFTTLRDAFTDHHFLYHLALVPFVALPKTLMAVKLATALFGAAFFASVYWFIRRFRFSGAWFYTLVLMASASFTFRIGLIKANSLSLIVLVLILFALFEKKWWLLAALNFVYVWLYGGWLFAWVIAAVYVCVTFLYRRAHTQKIPWYQFWKKTEIQSFGAMRAVIATVGGSVTGLLINPYFPQNLYFYWQQIWQIAIVNLGGRLNVGGEWSSLPPVELLIFFSFIPILYGIGLVLMVFQTRDLSVRSWTLLVLSFITIVFTVKSRRYIELSAPLAVLYAASVWADCIPRRVFRDIWKSWKPSQKKVKQSLLGIVIIAPCIFFFLPNIGMWSQIRWAREQLVDNIPLARYEPAAQWLRDNTEPTSTIVLSDWDDWPMFFYHNDQNYYVVGLDPTFMYNYDAELYDDWAELTANGNADNVVALMERLNSEYTVIEKRDHIAMQHTISMNIYFRLVYEDAEVWIYHLNESAS